MLAFAVCISISFLILLYIIQNKMTDLNANQTTSFNQQIVQSKGNEVGNWLYQRICELRTVSQYDEFFKGGDIDDKKVQIYLDRLNKRIGNLFGSSSQTFIFINQNGIGWTNEGVRIDISEREYFQEAVAADETKEYIISKALISKVDKQRNIFICYPIRNNMGEKVCYIVGAVAIETLDSIVSGIQIFDGSVWIMDRYGRVISQDKNHLESDEINPSNLSLTKTAMEIQQKNYGVKSFEIGKTHGQLIFSAIPYTDGWRLCVLAKEDIVYSETRNVQQSIIIIWIVLLALALVVSMLFSHNIVKPLKKLQAAMEEVERGNLDVGFHLQTRDEISQLSQSFNSMVARIKALLSKVVDEQKEKRLAELRALQSQINPHFLYNTLDTLKWKALDHNAIEIADMINALSGFFRISLSGGKEMITLDQEVEHAYHYLFIQKMRYSQKLDFDIRLQEDLESHMVIKILLQPIIENAIYHGIKPSEKKGHVEVEITSMYNIITMKVADNGVGMDEHTLCKLKNGLKRNEEAMGYGLFNVNERVRLAYGEEFGINIHSKQGEGTTVTLRIPLQREDLI